ncbi:MAG: SusC/RagA family TonB-linked outer membrane protein [Chitinophagaceae bacterium]|nr:SusC/RagA family TonB-linked outer membrane protein [Chitinophagaceae bacterium]
MKKLLLAVCCLLLTIMQVQAQNLRTFSGRVTDNKGNPLSGVSVTAGNAGTTTNANGNFTMRVPASARSLTFSYVGFGSVTQNLNNSGTVNVSLSPEDRSLSEVVVVGYGTQKRKEVTGNVATVKGSAIAEKPVQSFEQALAGKAAGVQITVPNGVLNNPPVFRIRGTNSISLSSYPLIVIDGVPSYTGDQGGTSAPANALASINPNDIESIDIAKDAAAAAIYGSRAANGVVFITTKKGRPGKAKVSYDGWVGFSQATRLPEILNTQQYVDYKNVALANLKINNPSTFGSFIVPAGGGTNWYDEVYRKAFSQSHNVNVSGGSEGTTYYFSAGYTKQEGILKKNDFERKNVLLNVDSRVNKWVSMGGKLSYSNERNLIGGSSGSLPGEGFASAGAARLAFALPPNVSPYNANGTYNIASATAIGDQGSKVNGSNPYTFNNVTLLLDLNRSNNEVNHLQSNAYFQLKPLNWITLRTVYGIDNLLIDNDVFYNPYHGDGAGSSLGPGGGGSLTFSKDKSWIWTTTAQFDFSLRNKHNFSFLAGNEQQRRTSTGLGISRRTLSDSAYTFVQAGFTTNNAAGLALGENFLLSNFGRLNYNFSQKYFISANVRQDEYSALGIKKGTFWGVSAGWEITKEKLWADAGMDNVFSSFKIRGSYGKVGNIAGVGNYPAFSQYGSGLYGGSATLAFSTVGNNQITWETSTKSDVGFSFGLFHDKLTGEFAYYKNNIDNLILSVPQAPSTGLPNILQNVGTMYNKGMELTLNASLVTKKDFSWNSSFTFAYNKNEVTALAPGLLEIQTSTSGLETVNKTLPGYSAGYLWVIRTGGVDPASGRRIYINGAGNPVLYQFGSVLPAGQFNWTNPDGTQYKKNGVAVAINQADDAVLYGNTQPKYIGGWDNTFRVKDFDINVLLTYQAGFYVYYGSNAGLHDQRFWNNATDVLNYWQKPGDAAAWPKPMFGDNVSNGSAMPMDINVFKGDFVKLKSISLGYSLSKGYMSKAGISGARVYISAQNLAILTNYPGPDPEVSSNGNSGTSASVDRNTLANGRTITVGLNINF